MIWCSRLLQHLLEKLLKSFKGPSFNPKDGKLAVLYIDAWCDIDLYMWHWFAGSPGNNNDLTIWDPSLVLQIYQKISFLYV